MSFDTQCVADIGTLFDQAAADFGKALELARWNTRTSWSNRGGIGHTICQWDDGEGQPPTEK